MAISHKASQFRRARATGYADLAARFLPIPNLVHDPILETLDEHTRKQAHDASRNYEKEGNSPQVMNELL